MLDENAVVNSLCSHLESSGYGILKRCKTTEKGVDIVALDSQSRRILKIEAKGGTSSVENSNRFGQPYTQTQVFDRVSKGVFTALQLHASREEDEDAALAVPNTRWFRYYLDPVRSTLESFGIKVFLVNEDGTVDRR
jgi:hypothetical protein